MNDNTMIELEALVVEKEAMKAGNSLRVSEGFTIIYDDISFFKLAEKMRGLKNTTRCSGR